MNRNKPALPASQPNHGKGRAKAESASVAAVEAEGDFLDLSYAGPKSDTAFRGGMRGPPE